jgi:6-pyruvoyltetrahydropterin/6-carboxytetrahydropterin synthase
LFTIIVESGFTASHALLLADGSREPRHVHEWKVRAAVSSQTLDESGLAVDFLYIRAILDDIMRPLGGAELETLPFFEGRNASAEHVAVHFYEQIAGRLEGRIVLEYVEVMEAKGCWVKFTG